MKTIGKGVADPCLFDRDALQEYVLACCEMGVGGFRDKPGKYALLRFRFRKR